ncbi:uncharacterized protein [Lepeophtheirus salmonis]|uniref:uncharacterized protein n=1 Tax=Lepeophtheirus salmonis TaxID=72036 RepID=UPI003AF3C735
MSMSSPQDQVDANINSQRLNSVHDNNHEVESPEFTEFGIKISKLRLTFKLRRRRRRSGNLQTPQEPIQQHQEEDNLLINDLSDTVLRTLDLDSSPRSRIPINSTTTNANMEFTGFYTAPPSVYTSSSSSSSSGYGSSISTNSDLYSEVYSESLRARLPPPLPPRQRSGRAPARPPYPSSIVRVVHEITEPISR